MVTGNNTMFEAIPGEMVIEIEIERLRDFHGHPFMVRDDDQMKSLKESIDVFCKYKIPKVADKNGESCISILEKVAGCPKVVIRR